MSIIEAIIQGLIQGFTEFLPVSSSGHLSVFQHLFGISGDEAVLMTISLHIGTLVAVFVAFRKKIMELIKEFFVMVKDIFTGKFRWNAMNRNRRMIVMIVISILPLFIFYIFKDYFTAVSADSDIIAEGLCFIYTSIILTIGLHTTQKHEQRGILGKTAGEVTLPEALIIGFFQGVALLPGVSRSGSTISAGMIAGLRREDAVEYSFILGIPVILAGALSEFMDLGEAGADISVAPIVVGMIVAAVAGYLAISLVKWLMKSDKFRIFAVYTLVFGIAVLGIGIYEHVSGNMISFAN